MVDFSRVEFDDDNSQSGFVSLGTVRIQSGARSSSLRQAPSIPNFDSMNNRFDHLIMEDFDSS